ncbi:hypothetical protein MG293_020412 [Ovis ammon polii]|uniref:Uncharacterized protein n=1 Tax=Ovis ammon polii TaxID=230172 RepID=A0AAD4XZR6_OVIAM|nr:hypothetical protein MG293_020412 [Ovis ammon polii]
MGKETEAFYMHAVSAIFTRGLSLSNEVHPHPPADSQEGCGFVGGCPAPTQQRPAFCAVHGVYVVACCADYRRCHLLSSPLRTHLRPVDISASPSASPGVGEDLSVDISSLCTPLDCALAPEPVVCAKSLLCAVRALLPNRNGVLRVNQERMLPARPGSGAVRHRGTGGAPTWVLAPTVLSDGFHWAKGESISIGYYDKYSGHFKFYYCLECKNKLQDGEKVGGTHQERTGTLFLLQCRQQHISTTNAQGKCFFIATLNTAIHSPAYCLVLAMDVIIYKMQPDVVSVDDSDEIQNGFVFQYLGNTFW